jgi:hypothetical protein
LPRMGAFAGWLHHLAHTPYYHHENCCDHHDRKTRQSFAYRQCSKLLVRLQPLIEMWNTFCRKYLAEVLECLCRSAPHTPVRLARPHIARDRASKPRSETDSRFGSSGNFELVGKSRIQQSTNGRIEDSLYMVAVQIRDKGGVVVRPVMRPEARSTIVGAPVPARSLKKLVDSIAI